MPHSSDIYQLSPKEIADGIKARDRVILGKAITLVESKNLEHQRKADQLLEYLFHIVNHHTRRIAISGAPGVGKSSTIENLGMHLIEQGRSVAVLSIDPSSDVNRGSILGDKTRMERLSVHPNAFIRPSPAGDFLGGVAWRTREAILILEAAGYDDILVETVGVGQSEFKVKDMVDCFVLLLSPAGGDELQGVKRGIVEIADILSVNKCDGDLIKTAIDTKREYQRGTHLFPARMDGWSPKVCTSSNVEVSGIDNLSNSIQDYFDHMEATSQIDQKRKQQLAAWLDERIQSNLMMQYRGIKMRETYSDILSDVANGKISPIDGAKQLLL